MQQEDYKELDGLLADFYRAQYQLTTLLNGSILTSYPKEIADAYLAKHQQDVDKTRRAMIEFIIKLENRFARQIPDN